MGLALSCALAAPVSAQDVERRGNFHWTSLGNGLQIIVVENHTAPLATVLVAVRAGAETQRPGEEGLAHLYEHVLFRSYRGTPGAFDREVADLNAYSNGATEEEVAYYYLTLPSENVDAAIQILARLVMEARFDEGDLEAELPVVADELKRAVADPEQVLHAQVERRMWDADWHRHDVAGNLGALVKITVDHLNETYERYYVPNNTALIVTGDVTVSDVVEEAQRRFDAWIIRRDPFDGATVAPPVPLTADRAIVVPWDVPEVTIALALRGPELTVDTTATYAADLLLEILNEPSAAFQQRLVGSGLFHSIDASGELRRHSAPIAIVGKTSGEQAQEALLALATELNRLDQLPGITDEDLLIARRYRALRRAIATEATAELAPTIASGWASAGIEYYLSYGEHIDALNLEDLRSFAQEYIVLQPKTIGILVPSSLVEEVSEWLAGMLVSRP